MTSKLEQLFTVAGRQYLARTLKLAKREHELETRAAFRGLDFGPARFVVGAGRLVAIECAFGSIGYSFVNPETGKREGGGSYGPHVSLAEVERNVREHLAQLEADAARGAEAA